MTDKYQHIFFDLDRTLWDFELNSKKVLLDIFRVFDLYKWVDEADTFVDRYKLINEDLWSLYRENKLTKEELRWRRFADTLMHFGKNDESKAKEIGEYYVYHSPRQTALFPYSDEILNYLSTKYQLHIITNGFEEVQHIKLNQSKIDHYFNHVILSEKVGVKKPHPYIFKKAMQLAQSRSENSLMIGDDWYADVYGASRVGMDSVYFNPNKIKHNNSVKKEISCLSELKTFL